MLGWLFNLGTVSNHGMGPVGISWSDLAAWAQLVGVDLTPWEGETLFEMSAAYANMLEKAKDPACPAPWEQSIEEQRKDVSSKLAQLFAAMTDGTLNA